MDVKKARKLVKDYKRKNPVDISGYVVLIDDAIEAEASNGRECLDVVDLCRENNVTRPGGTVYDEIVQHYKKAGLKVSQTGVRMMIDWKVDAAA